MKHLALLALVSNLVGGHMSENPFGNVVSVIQTILSEGPLSKETMENKLGIKMAIRSDEEAYTIYSIDEGAYIINNLLISDFDMMITKNANTADRGAISFEIKSPCITVNDIKAYYPKLELVGMPYASAVDGSFVYHAPQKNGGLTFSFFQSNERCLSTVGLKLTK